MAQPRAIGKSITDIVSRIEQQLEGVRDEFLREMSEDLVQTSPIWSGRYITSHSISTSSSGGQFTGNLEPPSGPRTSVPDAYRAEARANLMGDIAALPPQANTIYINNNAPHAKIVEDGNTRVPAKHVYKTVLNRADIHLQTAINKVKGSQ
jgi:hypothetical protein